MNCKPGDWAVVVKGKRSRGRIVRVVRLVAKGEKHCTDCGRAVVVGEENMWLVSESLGRIFSSGAVRQIPIARDDELCPIRDPGEDAQDETLSWLPVPERDEVTA